MTNHSTTLGTLRFLLRAIYALCRSVIVAVLVMLPFILLPNFLIVVVLVTLPFSLLPNFLNIRCFSFYLIIVVVPVTL